MKDVWNHLKNNAIAGVLFLLPLYVLMIVFQKVFGAFAKFGSGMAKYFGLDTILGKNMANVFGVIFLIAFLVVCGFLVRLSFFKRISDSIDNNLKIYLPGYEKHKELAKQKLIKEEKKDEVVPVVPPKTPILFMQNDSWIPAFLQEKNENGEAVVYVLNPNTNLESVFYLTTTDKIKILNNVSESELLHSISNNGEGFLELLNK